MVGREAVAKINSEWDKRMMAPVNSCKRDKENISFRKERKEKRRKRKD